MKPIIGITTNYLPSSDILRKQLDTGAKGQDFSLLSQDYVRSVVQGGGIPVIIPEYDDFDYLSALLKNLDGILISGGNDIDPKRYGQRPSQKMGTHYPVRDDVEFFITNYAINNKMPILGICRGFQVINVACGGTLYEDLPSAGFLDHALNYSERYLPVHSVFIEEKSKFYNVHGVDKLMVNSLHHQGVKDLGEGLVSTAVSEDGLCEAFESKDSDLIMGVQWHPEMMSSYYDEFIKIFSKFSEICIQKKSL